MDKRRLFSETLKAAQEFNQRAPWQTFGSDDFFLVELPGEEHPLAASILGSAGEEWGLGLMRGENAPEAMSGVAEAEAFDEDLMETCASISFTMTPFRDVGKRFRNVFEEAGFQARREALVPFFTSKEPGKRPRELKKKEAVVVLPLLRAVLKVLDSSAFSPGAALEKGEILVLSVSGSPRDPEVKFGSRPFRKTPGKKRKIHSLPPASVRARPVGDAEWLVGFPVLPAAIENDDRILRMALVADVHAGLILKAEACAGNDVEAASKVLFRTFEGKGPIPVEKLPRRIAFTHRSLLERLSAPCRSLGIECSYVPEHPLLEEILDSLEAFAGSDTVPAEVPESRVPGDGPGSGLPAPGDLDAWKEADREVAALVFERVNAAKRKNRRTLRKYLGTPHPAPPFLVRFEPLDLWHAFYEWAFVFDRPTRKSRTLLEKDLSKTHPPVVRALLWARKISHPSLYRIVSVDRGVSLTFADVLLEGKEIEVHDQALSESVGPGFCMPASVRSAGDFLFLSPIGPPIHERNLEEAVAYLDRRGLERSEAWLRDNAHLFGGLWALKLLMEIRADRKMQKLFDFETLRKKDVDSMSADELLSSFFGEPGYDM